VSDDFGGGGNTSRTVLEVTNADGTYFSRDLATWGSLWEIEEIVGLANGDIAVVYSRNGRYVQVFSPDGVPVGDRVPVAYGDIVATPDGGFAIPEGWSEAESADLTSALDFKVHAPLWTSQIRGTSANETLTAQPDQATRLEGRDGNDILVGSNAVDVMIGGRGIDQYYVNRPDDIVIEFDGEGIDVVYAPVSVTLSANVENLVLTGSGAVKGTGNALANIIYGNDNANVLDGGTSTYGIDRLYGGGGADRYIVEEGDIVTETESADVDTVESHGSHTLGAHVENLILTGAYSSNGTGNGLANLITGNDSANLIKGLGGDDRLEGGGGGDTIEGGEGADALYGGAGADQLTGGAGADRFVYLAPGDSPSGAVDRIRDFAVGIDKLDLVALGSVEVSFAQGTDGGTPYTLVQIGAAGGTMAIRVDAPVSRSDLLARILVRGTAGPDALDGTPDGEDIVGEGGDDTLNGLGGDDLLDGGLGADAMAGGLGDDTYVVDQAGDSVGEGASSGTDTVRSSIAWTLGANVENLVLTGSALNGTGNGLANAITGNAANNVIDGGAGADVMEGGAGHDIYHVDNALDQVTDTGGGNDRVFASVSHALGTGVDYLTLTGSAAIDGTGNALNNLLDGNSAANLLDGGLGADTMTGGAGNDIYVVENGSDRAIEVAGGGTDTVRSARSWTLGAEIENLVLTGTSAVNGTGNALANSITGNAAANRLDGGAGADVLAGGGGNDVYIVDAEDSVVEAAVVGTDRVESALSWTLGANFEDLTLTGAAAANGTGNGSHNLLVGNGAANTLTSLGGNDILDGGAGGDTLDGGAGHDVYHVDEAGDAVTDTAGGNDHVHSAVSYTLGTGLEYLTLTGNAATDGTGNAVNNLLYGNAAANRLDGGLGVDFMTGGAGDDIYVVDNGSDRTVEQVNGGTDTVESRIYHQLQAAVEHLVLTGAASINGLGNELDNAMTGNSANNMLTGALGADTLTGGGGNDLFAYRSTGESTAGARDEILDFTAGDRIELRPIDASSISSANNEAFVFIGSNAFGGTAGELRAWEDPSGKWFVEGDTDGDQVADLVIGVTTTDPAHVLGAGDFLL
jgi:Ca2+-binding RTX toxin-like protein